MCRDFSEMYANGPLGLDRDLVEYEQEHGIEDDMSFYYGEEL